jgi:SPP1 family predicted phage head-tail adaptor
VSLAAGTMNRRITVQRRTGARDALNQPVDTWENVFPGPLWCNIKGATGLGTIKASLPSVPTEANQYSFRIRYRPTGIDIGMRVVDKAGTIFDIKAIRHDMERQEWTDLVCETGRTNG